MKNGSNILRIKKKNRKIGANKEKRKVAQKSEEQFYLMLRYKKCPIWDIFYNSFATSLIASIVKSKSA